MAIYVALLRGINIGSKSHRKTVLMGPLKKALLKEFDEVTTYLQSGNVVFSTAKTSLPKLQSKFHTVLKNEFNLENIPLMILSADVFESSVEASPYKDITIFLNKEPAPGLVENLQEFAGGEDFEIFGTTLHLSAPNGFSQSKVGRVYEKKLSVIGTARNWNTVTALVAEINNLSLKAA
eukprot:TRINITY_DN6594_c0_g1_i1.p1 TRINITY_DN6594_c0_g1~~TRINITY_DN6594_c0_g1_i1.p1  ORF type:complete len:195 (+),score=21.89 TRINITY_DN6594_c0_g1_i1:49-585(+)